LIQSSFVLYHSLIWRYSLFLFLIATLWWLINLIYPFHSIGF